MNKIKISIALVGNPTSGLTTLFNRMTNGIEHSGQFATPRHKTKEGPVRDHPGVNVIELPGLYSLSAYSPGYSSERKTGCDYKHCRLYQHRTQSLFNAAAAGAGNAHDFGVKHD